MRQQELIRVEPDVPKHICDFEQVKLISDGQENSRKRIATFSHLRGLEVGLKVEWLSVDHPYIIIHLKEQFESFRDLSELGLKRKGRSKRNMIECLCEFFGTRNDLEDFLASYRARYDEKIVRESWRELFECYKEKEERNRIADDIMELSRSEFPDAGWKLENIQDIFSLNALACCLDCRLHILFRLSDSIVSLNLGLKGSRYCQYVAYEPEGTFSVVSPDLKQQSDERKSLSEGLGVFENFEGYQSLYFHSEKCGNWEQKKIKGKISERVGEPELCVKESEEAYEIFGEVNSDDDAIRDVMVSVIDKISRGSVEISEDSSGDTPKDVTLPIKGKGWHFIGSDEWPVLVVSSDCSLTFPCEISEGDRTNEEMYKLNRKCGRTLGENNIEEYIRDKCELELVTEAIKSSSGEGSAVCARCKGNRNLMPIRADDGKVSWLCTDCLMAARKGEYSLKGVIGFPFDRCCDRMKKLIRIPWKTFPNFPKRLKDKKWELEKKVSAKRAERESVCNQIDRLFDSSGSNKFDVEKMKDLCSKEPYVPVELKFEVEEGDQVNERLKRKFARLCSETRKAKKHEIVPVLNAKREGCNIGTFYTREGESLEGLWRDGNRLLALVLGEMGDLFLYSVAYADCCLCEKVASCIWKRKISGNITCSCFSRQHNAIILGIEGKWLRLDLSGRECSERTVEDEADMSLFSVAFGKDGVAWRIVQEKSDPRKYHFKRGKFDHIVPMCRLVNVDGNDPYIVKMGEEKEEEEEEESGEEEAEAQEENVSDFFETYPEVKQRLVELDDNPDLKHPIYHVQYKGRSGLCYVNQNHQINLHYLDCSNCKESTNNVTKSCSEGENQEGKTESQVLFEVYTLLPVLVGGRVFEDCRRTYCVTSDLSSFNWTRVSSDPCDSVKVCYTSYWNKVCLHQIEDVIMKYHFKGYVILPVISEEGGSYVSKMIDGIFGTNLSSFVGNGIWLSFRVISQMACVIIVFRDLISAKTQKDLCKKYSESMIEVSLGENLKAETIQGKARKGAQQNKNVFMERLWDLVAKCLTLVEFDDLPVEKVLEWCENVG